SFSSTGPTNDGRIKPEVVAPGASVYGAYVGGYSDYTTASGTSLSTPLTAGAATLVLCARPELSPLQVIHAIERSAIPVDLHDARFNTYPNNFVGYGMIDAFQAALQFGPIFSAKPAIGTLFNPGAIQIGVASKFGIKADSVFLNYGTSADGFQVYHQIAMTLTTPAVYATSGTYAASIPNQSANTVVKFTIEARDSAGNVYSSPPPVRRTQWTYTTVDTSIIASKNQLKVQIVANAFPGSVTIYFSTPQPMPSIIDIYNILGQHVKSVFNGYSFRGLNHPIVWDGRSDQGLSVASGIYFCRLQTPSGATAAKMYIVR
ncbi:MAG TPA: S8 family serine peptidase, partial [Bacteroidota bacterium]|nr:S8 family serine peptidase [Bacteroidota bacterium]